MKNKENFSSKEKEKAKKKKNTWLQACFLGDLWELYDVTL